MANRRIIDAILARRDEMENDPVAAARNQTLSVAALQGGIDSVEWRSYMMQFLKQDPPGTPIDEDQLKRLLGTDGTRGDPDLDLKRAYILAGGPCGSETRGRFGFFVNTIDRGLTPGCLAEDDQGQPVRPKRRPTIDTKKKASKKKKPVYPK